MAEYINRDEVMRIISILRPKRTESPVDRAANIAHDYIEKGIILLPAADVRENVLGEWVDDGFLNRKTCSICGAWIADNTGTAELNYCPNCGADMRGDNNGKN